MGLWDLKESEPAITKFCICEMRHFQVLPTFTNSHSRLIKKCKNKLKFSFAVLRPFVVIGWIFFYKRFVNAKYILEFSPVITIINCKSV